MIKMVAPNFLLNIFLFQEKVYICGEQKQEEMEKLTLTKEQLEIVKREHPEWFNVIEAGKWYFKQYDGGSSIIFFCQGHRNGNAYGYGIDTWSNGKTEWFSGNNVIESNNDSFREAVREEVEQALIAEAKRRYKVGDMVSKMKGLYFENGNNMIVSGLEDIDVDYDSLWVRSTNSYGIPLFKSGQWASVIPANIPSLKDDIQALKDRWPDINFTVIAEEKK